MVMFSSVELVFLVPPSTICFVNQKMFLIFITFVLLLRSDCILLSILNIDISLSNPDNLLHLGSTDQRNYDKEILW